MIAKLNRATADLLWVNALSRGKFRGDLIDQKMALIVALRLNEDELRDLWLTYRRAATGQDKKFWRRFVRENIRHSRALMHLRLGLPKHCERAGRLVSRRAS
jgi:hypothetical protein